MMDGFIPEVFVTFEHRLTHSHERDELISKSASDPLDNRELQYVCMCIPLRLRVPGKNANQTPPRAVSDENDLPQKNTFWPFHRSIPMETCRLNPVER